MRRRHLVTAVAVVWAGVAQAAIDIKTVTSDGGIDAWVVEEPAIPFVALEIRIRGGSSLDLPGKRGATNLMAGLIEEGSGEMTAQEFQTELENLAATFRFQVYDDTMSISAQFLSENRDEALALLKQALTQPRFDQDAIDRVRAQVITGINSDAKNPNRIASEIFNAAAFGDHPYGTNMDGSEESVSALTQEDLFTAHRNAITRDRMFVSAVGDVTAETIGVLSLIHI